MIEQRFYRGAGDREASPITSSYIANLSMATVRAKRFFDDPSQGAYYNVKELTFVVPHYWEVKRNTWIKITDSKMGLNRIKAKVISVQTEYTNSSIFDTISCRIFEEPS